MWLSLIESARAGGQVDFLINARQRGGGGGDWNSFDLSSQQAGTVIQNMVQAAEIERQSKITHGSSGYRVYSR